MEPHIAVLAAPGAGGARLAAALAVGTGRTSLVWDECRDDGDDVALRAAARRVLARQDLDWTCPPAVCPEPIELDDDPHGELAALAAALSTGPAVLYDVALPAVLPALLAVLPSTRIVVLAGEDERSVRALEEVGLEPGLADELVRATNHRLHLIAEHTGGPVLPVTAGVEELAAGLALELGPGRDVPPDPVDEDDRQAVVEIDEHLRALHALAARDGSVRQGPVDVADLRVRVPAVLDRHGGPRAVVRRQQVRLAAARQGATTAVLECTRATGLGMWSPDEPAMVEHVDGPVALRRVLSSLDEYVGSVLLPDILSWADDRQLREGLALAADVVAVGGLLVIGHGASVAADREQLGLPAIGPRDVEAAGEALDLTACGVVEVDGVTAVVLMGHTGLARHLQGARQQVAERDATIERLEAALVRRTAQRDAAVQKFHDLSERRLVRGALWAAERLAPLLHLVRRVRRGG